MSDKRYLNGLVIAAVSIAALCGQVGEAAQLRVTNVAMVPDGHVKFDITWKDSWRASWKESGTRWTNWDAVWVFVKYRKKGGPRWSHATLSAKDADHSAPPGAQIDVGLTAARGMGVFLYRSAEGKGTWANKGVKLKWLYKDDKVADPAKVELSVHAIEMVYVPKGSFFAGGGGKSYVPGRKRKQEAGSLTDGAWKNSNTTNTIPFKISSEAELKIANAPGCLWGTFNMGPAGKLPAEFPKGYGAFYCMKYETSQGQYAKFLSRLTEAQAAGRYPRPSIPARFIGSGMHTVTKTSAGYTATKPAKACNWISWADGAAYADWAALRPMTELEYEKACRGPLNPTPYEYAWGSATLSDTAATGHKDTLISPYPVGLCGKAARAKAGSTYWGIATMSGHLRERTVTVGVPAGRLFTGACGDGALAADGHANVAGWPGPSTAGAGFRGGPWYGDKVRLQVSDRFLAVCLRPQRAEAYGFRGVRQAPSKRSSKTVTSTSNAKAPRRDKPTASAGGKAPPEASPVVSVPDVRVSTVVGHLPRLPYRIPGVYRNGTKGPALRVIWPAPKDNRQAQKAGSYSITGKVPGTAFKPKAVVTVKAPPEKTSTPKRRMEPFPLGHVTLNKDRKRRDTQFIKNRNKFILALAKTDPDRFLYNFRDAFGQTQPKGVKPLRGWDSQKTRLRGHASGHYLSAIAQGYAGTTYDKKLRKKFMQKMEYSIDTLYALSQLSGRPAKKGGPCNVDPAAVPKGPGKKDYDSNLSKEGIRTDYWNWGKGFISGYPPDQFIMLEKGAKYGGKNTQIWAPYYTLHKILAGLLDCYELGGNEKALKIVEGMGTWVYQRLKVVPADTRISMWNRYIAGEYGGMNEVMARLHTITGKKKFLECARLFDNISIFFGDAEYSHGLARNVDTLRSKHANQHIPQITGALETYKGTGDIQYYRVADNFWDICTNSYMYSIGGVAGSKKNAECFTAQPNTLFANGFHKGGQCETCATYNLLKLSRQLFMFNPDGKFMDYYEQALYNHILASVAKDSPGNTYHVPLNPGVRKHFGNSRMNGFSCCNGTALESNTKLQDSIYFKSLDNSTLYINLYVPSALTWKDRNVVLTQSTNYPYDDTTKLTLTGSGEFTIQVRVPRWATRGFSVKINGRDQPVAAKPGTYLTLSRTWKDNDTIELKMPFHFYLSPVMDQPNIASIFYGPVLLAVEEHESQSTWRTVTLDADDIGKSITGDPGTLRFRTNGVNLRPFFEMYSRHSVYMDVTLK